MPDSDWWAKVAQDRDTQIYIRQLKQALRFAKDALTRPHDAELRARALHEVCEALGEDQ